MNPLAQNFNPLKADYFCLIARELGATDIPAKSEQPKPSDRSTGYLIQLTV